MADHTHPIYSLERNTQANLLSEALLREFMHKRKFLNTLKQFDQENPRNEMTVSSRNVMIDTMMMQKVMPQMKSAGIDSIVEAICEHRLGKRPRLDTRRAASDELGALKEQADKLEKQVAQRRGEVDAAVAAMKNKEEELLESLSVAQRKHRSGGKKRSGNEKTGGSKKTSKKHQSEEEVAGGAGDDDAASNANNQLSLDELLESNESHTAVATQRSFRRQQQTGGEQQGGGVSTSSAPAAASSSSSIDRQQHEASKKPGNNKAAQQPRSVLVGVGSDAVSDEDEGDDNNNDSDASGDDDGDYAAGLRAIREEEAQQKRRKSLVEEEDDDDDDAHNPNNNSSNKATPTTSTLSSAVAAAASSSTSATAAQHHHHHGHHHGHRHNNATNTAGGASSSPQLEAPTPTEGQLGTSAATDVFALLTGGPSKKIPASFFQPILFQTHDDRARRPYGLLQKMGGPCGAIAAIQARLLVQWFFNGKNKAQQQQQHEALNAALSQIFRDILTARAKQNDPVVCVLPPAGSSSSSSSSSSSFSTTSEQQQAVDTAPKQLAWLACCDVLSVSPSELLLVSSDHQPLFPSMQQQVTDKWMSSKWGLLCFIVSCVLTRSSWSPTTASASASGNNDNEIRDCIIAHMDEPRPLIVEHGYCSQEMVNLFLCGVASSHVHDGTIHVDGHSDMALRGLVPLRPGAPLEVGFLSMMEVRKLLAVGDLGKNPKYPVWIIFNESHFTVLFAREEKDSAAAMAKTAEEQEEGAKFDLTYYDPQCADEEYRLTLTMSAMPLPARKATVLVSYVDQIIRTRSQWALARVNWNGAEPLL